MNRIRFDCGCEFDLNENGGPILREHEFNYNCPKTYAIIQQGRTQGLFQLESNLLKQKSKAICPSNPSEMSDLVAIVRPGTLKSVVGEIEDEKGNKKKITAADQYIMVKNGKMEIKYFHPSLEPILKKTNGIILYQEQILQIAQLLANFDLVQADLLRRGIGKKKAEIVAECKQLFIDKAEQAGILSREKAEQLFAQIEASNRYSFNKSHSFIYGMTALEAAFQKAHFPIEFYQAALEFCLGEQDPLVEIRKLVSDARKVDIEVLGPNINHLEKHFYIHPYEEKICFGLSDIKGISETTVDKIINVIHHIQTQLGKPVSKWTWFEFLVNCTMARVGKDSIGVKTLETLVAAGALQVDDDRQKMLFELKNWQLLSKGEQEWLYKNQSRFTMLVEAVKAVAPTKKNGGGCHSEKKSKEVFGLARLLENPPTSLDDTVEFISKIESELLGVSLSCSKVEACDLTSVNITCKEFNDGKRYGRMTFGVEIKEAKEIECKNGQSKGRKMGFLTAEDPTGEIDNITVFSDEWFNFSHFLQAGNTVLIQGEPDNYRGGIVLKNVIQI